MNVRKNNNAVEISFAYNPQLVALVKSLDGRKYDPQLKRWYIPFPGCLPVLESLAARGFAIDPALWAEAKKDKEQAQAAEALAVLPDTEFLTPLPLFPYQKVGASFLYKIGSGLIGDEPGLGKTIMSLAVCEKAQAQKVLIFCPAAVKFQWEEEIKKFLSKDSKIVVINGTAKQRTRQWRSEARFYIANYELLLRDFESIDSRIWDIIIADEATRISNPMAKQSKIIKKLKATRKIAMTGTPVSNWANEVWNLVDFICPGALGNYFSFLQRYCLKNQWGGIFGYQHMDELAAKLKRYMIRRLKVDVLPELPEKICTDIPFDLTEEEKKLYKQLKKEILFEIHKTDIDKIESPMTIQYTLVKMLRLRQLADSMELLGQNIQSSKLAVLSELLKDTLTGDRKAIVFTQFAEMANILERELKDWAPLKISGETKDRQDIVNKFNNGEENKILIMTSAGQYGLNIQRASIIFHYDQEWSLAKMLQREGRAHRIGQKETVLVYNLLAKGTLDYYVKKVLHAKAELSAQVLGDVPISMGEIKEMLTYEQ